MMTPVAGAPSKRLGHFGAAFTFLSFLLMTALFRWRLGAKPLLAASLASLLSVCLVACSGPGGPPAGSSATTAAPYTVAALVPPPMVSPKPALPPLFDDLQKRSFDFFWETTNPVNGLVPDRWPNPPFASVASVGFALTAYSVGVERGYISRAQARARTLATVRFFRDAPQGPQATCKAGYRGFFYHFLDMNTGARFGKTELSTVDTSLLLVGLLFAQSYFDGTDAEEAEIRASVDTIAGRVDWAWAQQNHPPRVTLGWHPETGFIASDWSRYNEAMLVVLMGMASPTQPLSSSVWTDLTSSYDADWSRTQGYDYLSFQALFAHQFTHLWVDFRGIQDAYIKAKGIDYFENSRRATYAQRTYAMANPLACKGYGENIWGISASDGPGDLKLADYAGQTRQFKDYFSRGVGLPNPYDDCTIAPSAAASSLPFAPELVIPAVQAMQRQYGATIYAQYGFLEAFNPSFVDAQAKLSNGRVVPGFGWVDTDYVGIDQGPIVGMIENYRSELVWRIMRKSPYLRRALERAGFTGGWLNEK